MTARAWEWTAVLPARAWLGQLRGLREEAARGAASVRGWEGCRPSFSVRGQVIAHVNDDGGLWIADIPDLVISDDEAEELSRWLASVYPVKVAG